MAALTHPDQFDGLAPFTMAQAAVIAGVPRKMVDQYVERDLPKLDADDLIVGRAGHRTIGRRGLYALRLCHELMDAFVPEVRLECIASALAHPGRKTVHIRDGKITVEVAGAFKAVTAGLKAYAATAALVHSGPEILGGEPCLKGTRVSVYLVHDLLTEAGLAEVKAALPQLSERQIAAADAYAQLNPRKGRPRSVASVLKAAKPRTSQTVTIREQI